MKMDDILKRIKDFHGHLGPFAALGYRMGQIANLRFGDDPFGKSARALTGTTRPLSCLVDGVQLSSGCTLGKGNIEVEDVGTAQVIFTDNDGKFLMIAVKQDIIDKINNECTKKNEEALAAEFFELGDDELFDINESTSN
jgi:formylmethanofuran dehydrogenase subunit E